MTDWERGKGWLQGSGLNIGLGGLLLSLVTLVHLYGIKVEMPTRCQIQRGPLKSVERRPGPNPREDGEGRACKGAGGGGQVRAAKAPKEGCLHKGSMAKSVNSYRGEVG